jgi:hypothetical protein
MVTGDKIDVREGRVGTCCLFAIVMCFIFPPTAPITRAILLAGTGLPAESSERLAYLVLKAGAWGTFVSAIVIVVLLN